MPNVTLSPHVLVAAAHAFVGLGDDALAAGSSRGVLVDCLLREQTEADAFPFERDGAAPAPRAAWDLAFVQHVGFWSHYAAREERTSWPLPRVQDADALARFARERCVLRHAPLDGDVFLLRSPARDAFVRVGIVAYVRESVRLDHGAPAFECVTIEGDSSPALALNGGTVHRHWRRLSPDRGDRFVRWAALDGARLDRESAIAAKAERPLLAPAA